MNAKSDATKIEAICKKLDNEPMFHMSLHSKELFHSNVLAWLFQKYPQVAKQILEKWVPTRETDIHRVRREHQQLDLVVEVPGLAPVIIENKVFAPVDNKQLDRYSRKEIEDLVDPKLILLSLGEPQWGGSNYLASGGEWTYVSYRDLANAISEFRADVEGFDSDVLQHYLSFVQLLQQFIDEIGDPAPNEPLDIGEEVKSLLKEIRIYDAMAKLRSRKVISTLEKSITQFGNEKSIVFKSDFTRGQTLIEAFVALENGDELGWQYQGDQWRLAVKTNVHFGKTDELRKLRHGYVAKEYAEWFIFEELQELIARPKVTIPKKEQSGELYGYNPQFVYLYRKFPNLTLKEIERLSIRVLARAIEWDS